MKYEYVQLVAYQAPTLNLTDQPLPQSSKPTHKAVLNLENDDARNRVQRLLDVLHWAVETIPYNLLGYKKEPVPLLPDQTKTLKVFMAPEFYFRAAPEGYSWNTLTNILECLKLVFVDWRFDDWLIVPGTICSHQDPHPRSVGANEGKRVFFNTASAIKGGGNGSMTYVHKEHMSGMDGAPSDMVDGVDDVKFNAILGSWKEQKERRFNIDGLTFGLDVCLDHSIKALKRVVLNWPKQEEAPAPDIDVHLITSCGMQVKHDGVAARAGGCVLLCDGAPNQSPSWQQSAVYQVDGAGTASLDQKATLRQIPEVWRRPVPAACAIPKPKSARAWFDQEVVVYEAVKLT